MRTRSRGYLSPTLAIMEQPRVSLFGGVGGVGGWGQKSPCYFMSSPVPTPLPRRGPTAERPSKPSSSQWSDNCKGGSGGAEGRRCGSAETPQSKTRRVREGETLSPIDTLPDDLLVSILARVSADATSPGDVVNAMLVCRRFCTIAQQPAVLQMASASAVQVSALDWSDAAERFLLRLSEAGCAEASYLLGMILFYCIGREKRWLGAALVAKAAASRHAAALYAVAVMHFNGSGGVREDKDLEAGVALCARAAVLGHSDAVRELGHCLQHGYGIRQDVAAGRRLLCLLEMNAVEAAAEAAVTTVATATANKPLAKSTPSHPPPRAPAPPNAAGRLMYSPRRNAGAGFRVGLAPPPAMASRMRANAVGNDAALPDGSPKTGADGNHGACENGAGGAGWAVSVAHILATACAGQTVLAFDRKALRPSANQMAAAGGGGQRANAPQEASQGGDAEMDAADAVRGAPGGGRESIGSVQTGSTSCISGATSRAAPEYKIDVANHFMVHWFALGKEQPPGGVGLRLCSHADCGRVETRRHEFRRCSACGCVNYCSTVCQERDWKARHRRECNRLADGNVDEEEEDEEDEDEDEDEADADADAEAEEEGGEGDEDGEGAIDGEPNGGNPDRDGEKGGREEEGSGDGNQGYGSGGSTFPNEGLGQVCTNLEGLGTHGSDWVVEGRGMKREREKGDEERAPMRLFREGHASGLGGRQPGVVDVAVFAPAS